MNRFVPISCCVALILTSGVPAFAANDDLATRRAHLKTVLAEEWEHGLATHPETATYIGDKRYNDRLDDASAEAYLRDVAHARQVLPTFETIDTTGFPEDEKLNKTLMIRRLRMLIEGAKFKDWEMPINQMNGPHLDYAALPSQMPFETVKDYENYIARLHAIPRVFDQITRNMEQGLRDKLMPPKYLLEKAAAETEDIANKNPEDSPFAKPIKHFPSGFSSAEQHRLRKEILDAVRNDINPAYAKLAEFLRVQYAPHGRTEYGIWAVPNGDASYRYAIRQETTTNLTPEQIHALGLKQVVEIDAEMLKLAKSLGFADLKSFNEHIRNDKKLYGTSGEQVLGLYQHYKDQMAEKLPQIFGKLPKNKLEVVPMDAFRAPNAVPADYSPGTANGSRPGRINVNEYDPQHRLLLNVEAIAYHEGIPGHHLQFSIAQELPELASFRKYASYNAYSEGWALYAERLGKELGFYQDPYSEYGRLENEMWRAVRLVVDTGVHYKHWSRQQMIDFFHEHTAMDDQNIQTEVDRYICWPGQALSYKLGQMTILDLREQAKRELGSKFDIRGFHDAVLQQGPLPLGVLRDEVTRWIAEQKK